MDEIKEPPPTTKFRMSEGDWVCSDANCRNVNFARRNKCNRCNKEKVEGTTKKKLGQEIGKALADKSKGLFSADDWQCSKCGNVNWARRQQCNMCNAPKFGEVEERTGFGGGYNDRGVVEYIKRDDSDDEYDEFGRRKKAKSIHSEEDEDFVKKRKNEDETENNVTKKVKTDITDSDKESEEISEEKENEKEEQEKPDEKEPKPVIVNDVVDEDSEDEEDEDEDGDDLSKYDLSGWGDDEENSSV